jgi:hypothetical protein
MRRPHERELDRQRCNGDHHTLGNGGVERLGRHRQAITPRQGFAMLPVAVIDRVEPPIAGVACRQTLPAHPTDQQALKQAKTFSGRSGKDFAGGPICRQTVAVPLSSFRPRAQLRKINP